MPDLLSVIIPTYNRRPLLERALFSVARQTYRPLETIVVDDGSTDGTETIIEAQREMLASKGVSLIYERQANAGPSAARNRGIERSSGKYVGFLDSDDMWRPAYAQTMVNLLERYPSAGLAFGGYVLMDMQENVMGIRPTRLPPTPQEGLMVKPFESIIIYMPMSTCCVTVRRDVLDDVGLFDLSYRMGEDWDLWFRIARKYDFAYSLRGLSLFREHPNNMPKFDASAIAADIRLTLKHMGDVADPEVHRALEERVRRQTVLLQEQLLREGKFANGKANGSAEMLEHHLKPGGKRFAAGAWFRNRPAWAGRMYAQAIRSVGTVVRSGRRHGYQ